VRAALAATLLAGAILGAAAGTGPPATDADLVLIHGRVFTSDPSRPWAEAVAIRGDRIVTIGSSEEVTRSGTGARRIDLAGRVVVPGFNDAHDHVAPAPSGASLALESRDPSWDEVLAAVKIAAAASPAPARIFGLIGSRVFDDARATRFGLDAAAPGRFIYLRGFSGHGVIASTAAFRALDISEEPADPAGGWFDRMPGSRRASGLLHEYAHFSLGRRLAVEEGHAAAVQTWKRTSDEAVRLGITTIQNMSDALPAVEAAAAAADARVAIRVRQIRFPMTTPSGRLSETKSWNAPSGSNVTVSGIKWILDGTPLERTAAMRVPYGDRPGERGRLNFPESEIRAMLEEARKSGEPLMLHCAGDATAAAVFRQMQAVAPASEWARWRVRIEHGDGVTKDLFAEASRLGVIVVQNPAHFMLRNEFAARLGARHDVYQPVRSLKAAGIPLAIGSDGPLNPFLNILWATTDPNRPEEALTREEAVEAYTRGSARAEFADDRKGMLREGYLADLAVHSQDIFAVEPAKLPATQSVLTIVGGRIAWERKEPAVAAGP
jgi:predicted amidohydrolase YtcJ